MEYDSYDDDDIYQDINNITALISVFMQKALESASYYTIQRRKLYHQKIYLWLLKERCLFYGKR